MTEKWFYAGKTSVFCLVLLTVAQFTYAVDSAFVKSSTSFFNETETFSKESNLLIDNTQEVDTTLLTFENALSVPHNVATALKRLDDTLTVIKQMLVVAKQVPQTRVKAEKLEKDLDAIKPSVSDAAAKAAKLDLAVEPVRNAVNTAESAAEKALEYENKSKTVALLYIEGIEKLIECSTTKPTIEPQTIQILDSSTVAFSTIDKGMKQANQKYAATVALPEKALKSTITEITEQIKQLEQILAAIDGLQTQLHPLNNTLVELKKILDQSIGFSFQYPCGSKMCSQNTPYPCGVKTCKKYGVPYPCGTKICHKEVPYPCGVKMCSAHVSMALSTAINGTDAIESKVESLLSSTAWKALKIIGVKKYVDQLQKDANSLTGPVLSKLHLDISTNLPSLDIKLNSATLGTATQQLTQLYDLLTQFVKSVDISTPTFAPEITKLQLLDKDISTLLKVSGCQTAPTKPAPVTPKRVNWRKFGLM